MTIRTLLIFIAISASASEPQIILGVLEEVTGHYADEAPSRAVRVAFQKNGSEWKPFPSDCPDQACLKTITSEYPPTVTWTIAFSGRAIGQLTAETPKDFEYYSAVGLQKIIKGPSIGKRSLVAASQPYLLKIPTHGSPREPASSDLAASLRAAFRKKYPEVSNCTTTQYRDADIKLNKAYSSNKGWSAVELLLTGNHCEGPPYDAFTTQWFAVTPRGEAMFLLAKACLASRCRHDYDNDGKSGTGIRYRSL